MKKKYLVIITTCILTILTVFIVLAVNNPKNLDNNELNNADKIKKTEEDTKELVINDINFENMEISEFNNTIFESLFNQEVSNYNITSVYNGDTHTYKNVYTTTFESKDSDNFYYININEETGKIYEIAAYLPNVIKNSKGIENLSQDLKYELENLTKQYLANIGISTDNKQVENYYKSGRDKEFITVIYKDESGNREFIELSYEEKEIISYNYYEKSYYESEELQNIINQSYVAL